MAISNVVEYSFEGNILNLEQAIKRIKKLLTESAKTYKSVQEGQLTDEQKRMRRDVNQRLKILEEYEKNKLSHSNKQVLAAGKYLLHISKKIFDDSNRQKNRYHDQQRKADIKAEALATKLAEKAQEAAQKAAEERAELLSVSGQEGARVKTDFLANTLKQVGEYIDPKAYAEITDAVNNFRLISEQFKQGTASEDQLAETTEFLNSTFKNYDATLRRLKQSLSNANKGVETFNDLIDQFKNRIDVSIKSISFWIQALRKVSQVVKQGITYFSDYVESINFLRAASSSYANEMQEFTASQVFAFGLNPTEVNQASAMFYSFATSMGYVGEQAAFMSKNLTKIAQDLSSVQNIPMEEAVTKVRSAMAGYSRSLAQLGVQVNDTNVNEWLLSKGINRTMDTMNEASQAAARYAFMTERLSYAEGDLARTIQSPANQLKIFVTQIKLLAQNVGSIFTVVILPMVRMINPVLQAINAFISGLTSIQAEGFSGAIGDSADNMNDLTDSTEDATDAVNNLLGIDEINILTTNKASLVPGTIDPAITGLLEDWNNFSDTSVSLVDTMGALGESLAYIWSLLSNDSGVNAIALAFQGLGWVLQPVVWLFEQIENFFGSFPDWVQNIIGFISELIIMVAGLALGLKLLSVSWALVGKAIGFVITNLIVAGARMIWAGVQAVALAIKNLFLSGTAWKVAIAYVAVAGLAGLAIAGIIAAATSSVASTANNQTGGARSRGENVPAMAKGGVVSGPTFALVGEGQYNEAIVPLSNSPQFETMKRDIAEKVVQTNNRTNVPVVLQINGKELARTILPDLDYALPQTGMKLRRA